MNFWKSVAIFLATLVTSCATSIPIKTCGDSSLATILSVDAEPCPSLPCMFQRGRLARISVTFKAQDGMKTIQKAKALVYGRLDGFRFEVPFPIEPDACKSIKCPLEAGDTTTFSVNVPVRMWYPLVDVYVKLELQNDDYDQILCLILPVRVYE